MNTTTKAFALAFLSLAAPLFAQQPVDPKDVPEAVRKAQEEQQRKRLETINAQNPAKPVERPLPSVRSTDPDVQALVKLLTGTFIANAAGDTPALSLSTCVVTVDGASVDNAVYFELARADSTWAPFHQGIWQVWKKNGNLTVRQYDFTNVPATFQQAITGLWGAPDMFPVLKTTQLAPVTDVSLTLAGGNYSGSGGGPSLLNGAFEFATSWIITPDTLSFTDRGSDAAGKQVWGPAPGAPGPTFKRSNPVTKVERRNGGVVVIDFVPPSASERKIEDFSEAAGVVIGYTDTGAEFYNSSTPNQRTGMVEPLRWTNSSQMGVSGWTLGMIGATPGTVRRVYVPTSLGYGVRGNRNVPPNVDLIFTTQVQWVGDVKAPPAPAPAPGQPPAGGAAAPKPPAPKPAAAGTPAAAGNGVTAVSEKDVPPEVIAQYKKDQEKKRLKQQQPAQPAQPQPPK